MGEAGDGRDTESSTTEHRGEITIAREAIFFSAAEFRGLERFAAR